MSKTQRALSPSKANSSKRGKPNKAAEPQGIAIEHIQREDTPWAITKPAAVLPVGPRGSGESDVRVAYATPGPALHKKLVAAQSKGNYLREKDNHSLSKQAFAAQNVAAAKKGKPS